MITTLAGGVGAAKFLAGLIHIIKEDELSIIVNTGDDIELFGLHISPDVDIVTYTLAGIVDEKKGWGIREDTFQCLDILRRYGVDTWFNLGDRDLGTHLYRTNRLKQGIPLSQVTSEVCCALGLKVKILPMSDDRIETQITTHQGVMHFEEYFVKRQFRDEVLAVKFAGSESAKPAPGVTEAIFDADTVIIAPSNPIASIGAVLSVGSIREALKQTSAKIIAVSPIIAGAPIKGPADKMLRAVGSEVSAYGVAKLYSDFLDSIVIDEKDAEIRGRIEKLGLSVTVTNTIMNTLEDKISLAKKVTERQ